MSLTSEIESVLAFFPQKMIAEDAKKHRFTIINGGMGFMSRTRERDWLIHDNQEGRSMVLTGNLYLQFCLEMSVFWWGSEAEKFCKGKKTTWEGTEEEAMIAQDAIILKFFDMCEAEDDVTRRLMGKPTHQEEKTRKKELQDRKQVIENRINELDAEHERLFQRKEDELSDPSADWKKTYRSLSTVEKELSALENELFRIKGNLEFGFGY